jgi:predicted Holliday junction resolvase-like endonuclease
VVNRNLLSDPLVVTIGVLAAVVLILLLVVAYYKRKVEDLAARLDDEISRQRSLSSTYGRISEQWIPLSTRYPYDPQYFRFLGSPIDGVQFEEDRIVFIEFKANKSRLSENQKRIKRLVEEGYVYWDEFHFVDEEGE